HLIFKDQVIRKTRTKYPPHMFNFQQLAKLYTTTAFTQWGGGQKGNEKEENNKNKVHRNRYGR
ncbi:MAG: hypothetical protein LBJ00_13845, partial [Planctomycetaceae bacterium]|nr:hypothetical protein [Planctomycetaceae bacterium]